jgi:integrase
VGALGPAGTLVTETPETVDPGGRDRIGMDRIPRVLNSPTAGPTGKEDQEPPTLRTLNLVLAKAFTEQVGRTLGARKPRESDDERPVWSLAEARRFGDHVAGDRLYPMWRLLLVSSLRREELCGLRRDDLEQIQGTLTVRRQLVVEDRGSRVRVKPPKSHNGVRTLVLDPVTLELLWPVAVGPVSRYLFTGRTGRPMRPDNLTDRFNQLAVAARSGRSVHPCGSGCFLIE